MSRGLRDHERKARRLDARGGRPLMMWIRFRVLTFARHVAAFALALSTVAATAEITRERPAAGTSGQRVSINQAWRFQMGDPPGIGDALAYDVRPKVVISADGKEADARPDEAERVAP